MQRASCAARVHFSSSEKPEGLQHPECSPCWRRHFDCRTAGGRLRHAGQLEGYLRLVEEDRPPCRRAGRADGGVPCRRRCSPSGALEARSLALTELRAVGFSRPANRGCRKPLQPPVLQVHELRGHAEGASCRMTTPRHGVEAEAALSCPTSSPAPARSSSDRSHPVRQAIQIPVKRLLDEPRRRRGVVADEPHRRRARGGGSAGRRVSPLCGVAPGTRAAAIG